MHNFKEPLEHFSKKDNKYIFPHNGYKPEKKMDFFELEITIRAGNLEDINGLLPLVTSDFLLKQDKRKIGTWSGNDSNFVWHLNNLTD